VRKLIYGTMASLDGFMDRPDRNLEWVTIDEELHTYLNNQEREIGAYLHGRQMYEMMSAYWSTADSVSDQPVEIEYALIWQTIPKIVFSKTLEQVGDNARLVRGDAVAEVTRLKEEPGKNLGVGGAKLASALIRAGLVDEYQIYVQPVILGAGTPMFPVMDEAIKLRLVETHTFSSGVVYLRYLRAD